MCDHQRKIRDIFLGFPGSVHDSRVLRASPLFDTLAEKCQNSYLIGDSGYPCLRHLLTPYKDRGHLGRRERHFNLKLASNRYVVEHCFGIMKQKFRQLFHLKLRKINDIVNFIKACCVLHNLALDDEVNIDDPVEEHDNIQLGDIHDLDEPQDDRDGMQQRNYVADLLLQQEN